MPRPSAANSETERDPGIDGGGAKAARMPATSATIAALRPPEANNGGSACEHVGGAEVTKPAHGAPVPMRAPPGASDSGTGGADMARKPVTSVAAVLRRPPGASAGVPPPGPQQTFFTYVVETEMRYVFHLFCLRLGAAAMGVNTTGPERGSKQRW